MMAMANDSEESRNQVFEFGHQLVPRSVSLHEMRKNLSKCHKPHLPAFLALCVVKEDEVPMSLSETRGERRQLPI
jgi:hypothetical protein